MRKRFHSASIHLTDAGQLQAYLEAHGNLRSVVVQGVDLRRVTFDWAAIELDDHSLFLGCRLSLAIEMDLRRKGAQVFGAPDGLPYRPFRQELYDWQSLDTLQANGKPLDLAIYEHFSKSRLSPSFTEALWQRLHDHSMDDALRDLLAIDSEGRSTLKCVGFMGGHSTLRTDPYYRLSVETAKLLTEAGYFVVSGGGPGIMEAANLGAYLAGQPASAVDRVLQLLALAPSYQDDGYRDAALRVLEAFPSGEKSLAIPTWYYGHEPSNAFSPHIAKYFSNSIREDTLVSISLHGIVFAPGSAGTTQEIFMDATQNHYGTMEWYSPMVFLGRYRYEIETLLFPVLKQLSHGRAYHELLYLTDIPPAAVEFLRLHPPRKVEQ